MSLLVQSDMNVAINTYNTKANGLYVISFISEAYTLHHYTTIDRKAIHHGEIVVKAQYLFSMQENTNCYQEQQPLYQTIKVPTHRILHPRLDVIIIKDVQYTPKQCL